MKKKCLLIVAVTLFLFSSCNTTRLTLLGYTRSSENLSAQKIAAFPFVGSGITSTEEAEFYTGLFTATFVELGYTLVTRTAAIETAMKEINYQSSGMTDDIVEIGRQLSADYVLVGTLGKVSGNYTVRVEVVDVKTSEIAASDTQIIKTPSDIYKKGLYGLTLSENMVMTLHDQM